MLLIPVVEKKWNTKPTQLDGKKEKTLARGLRALEMILQAQREK